MNHLFQLSDFVLKEHHGLVKLILSHGNLVCDVKRALSSLCKALLLASSGTISPLLKLFPRSTRMQRVR